MSTPPPWDPRVWCLIDTYVGFEVHGILHINSDTKIYASLYSVYVTGLDPDAFDGRDHRERLTRAEKWLYTTLRPCGFISSWQAFTFPKVTNLNISLTFDSEDAARRALAMDGKRRQWDGSRTREMTIKVAVRTCRKKGTMALIKRADWPAFISRRLGDPHALDDARALNRWYPYSRETDFTLPMVPRPRNTTRFEDVGIPGSFQPHSSYHIVTVLSRGSWSPRNPSSPSWSVLEVTGEESKPSTAVVVTAGDKPAASSKGGKGNNHTGSSLAGGRWPRDKYNSQQHGNGRPHPYQGKNHEKKVRYKANKAAKEEAARRALEDKVRTKAKTLGRRLEAGKAVQQQKNKQEKRRVAAAAAADTAPAVGEPGEIIVTLTTSANGVDGTSNGTASGQTNGHHTRKPNGQVNGHTKETASGGAQATNTTTTPPDADMGAFYGPPRPDHILTPSITSSSSPVKQTSQPQWHHHHSRKRELSHSGGDDLTDELAQIRAEVDALLEVATKNLEAQEMEREMEQQSRSSSGSGRQSDEGTASSSMDVPNGVNHDDGIMVVDDGDCYYAEGLFFLDPPVGLGGYDNEECGGIGALHEKTFHSGRSSPPYSPGTLQFY